MASQTHFPYDIYFPTTSEECKDPHGRMQLACRRSRDGAAREVVMLHDALGNASRTLALPRTRGVAYPAAALVFEANGALGTVSIGTAEHVPMDQWLKRVSRSDRSVSRGCAARFPRSDRAFVPAAHARSPRAMGTRTGGPTRREMAYGP